MIQRQATTFKIVKANARFPAMTAQDVGREVYHGRSDTVQVIGDRQTLQKIAWILRKAPDMFEVRFQYASLIVRRANSAEAPGLGHDAAPFTLVSLTKLPSLCD